MAFLARYRCSEISLHAGRRCDASASAAATRIGRRMSPQVSGASNQPAMLASSRTGMDSAPNAYAHTHTRHTKEIKPHQLRKIRQQKRDESYLFLPLFLHLIAAFFVCFLGRSPHQGPFIS